MMRSGKCIDLNIGGSLNQGDAGVMDAPEIRINGLSIRKPITPRTTMFFQYHGGRLEETTTGVRLIGGIIAGPDVIDFKNKREILAGLKALTKDITDNWRNSLDKSRKDFNTFWLQVTEQQIESIQRILDANGIAYEIKKMQKSNDRCFLVKNDVDTQKKLCHQGARATPALR